MFHEGYRVIGMGLGEVLNGMVARDRSVTRVVCGGGCGRYESKCCMWRGLQGVEVRVVHGGVSGSKGGAVEVEVKTIR
jgi:hypothetical protein